MYYLIVHDDHTKDEWTYDNWVAVNTFRSLTRAGHLVSMKNERGEFLFPPKNRLVRDFSFRGGLVDHWLSLDPLDSS